MTKSWIFTRKIYFKVGNRSTNIPTKVQKPLWKAGNQIFFVYFSHRIRIQDSQFNRIQADPDPHDWMAITSVLLVIYFMFFQSITGTGRHTTSCCSMDHRWADALPTGTRHKISTLYFMDQKTIKTPNPKCRLYWCLKEFIDSQSASSLYRSIFKKSRQLGFGVFIVIWSLLYLILNVNLHTVIWLILQLCKTVLFTAVDLNFCFNSLITVWIRGTEQDIFAVDGVGSTSTPTLPSFS